MMLRELKQYLKTHHVATLAELARAVNKDPIIVKDMLSHWQRLGCITQSTKKLACGTRCQQCDEANFLVYEWV